MFCSSCGAQIQQSAGFCPNCGKSITASAAPAAPAGSQVGAGRPTKYCSSCGAVIDRDADICPRCGVRQFQPSFKRAEIKNPGIAAVLSFLFTGLGQIYNGQIGKGIVFVVLGIICLATIIVLIGFILYPLFWIYNIYDAYSTAKRINEGTVKPD